MCGCLSASIFSWEFSKNDDGWYGIDHKEQLHLGPFSSEASALEALRLAVRERAEIRNHQRMQEMGLI